MLSDTSDTFRLLFESVDFTDQDGNGWKVLIGLCDASNILEGEPAAIMAILYWMLRLFSSEIKMCGSERNYAELLHWTLGQETGLAEASRLILHLGGPELIDIPVYDDGGYNTVHFRAAGAEGRRDIDPVLAHDPDIHRLGCDFEWSPEEESPLSLVLYSSWAFRDWLDTLATAGKDFEEFVSEEIKRNHAIHPGWEKETLLNLSTYDYLVDYDPLGSCQCADCNIGNYQIRVQPHWRHFIERIKHGIDPYYSPAEASSEVDEEESAESRITAEAEENTDDPTDLDDIGSETDSESGSESLSEFDELGSSSVWKPEWELGHLNPHNYPTTVSLQSHCVYCPHEAVCMNCWLFYINTGTRRYAYRRRNHC